MPEAFTNVPAVQKFQPPLRANEAMLPVCSPWGEPNCTWVLKGILGAINPRALCRAGSIWVLLKTHHRNHWEKRARAEQSMKTGLRVGREIEEGKDMGGKRQRVRAQPWSLFHQRRGHPFLLGIAGGCWMS